MNVSAPEAPVLEGPFIKQTFTLDFLTSYANLLVIMDDMKKNELYSRVELITAEYQSTVPEQTAAPNSPVPAKPAATADPNIIVVHIEFSFYALQPDAGASPEPAMTPTVTARSNSLMP